MKIEASKCNWCESLIISGEETPGTIQINQSGFSIVGGEKTTKTYERFSSTIKSSIQRDFCSAKCFLHWLYLSKDTSNIKNPDYKSPFYQMINDEIGIKKEN